MKVQELDRNAFASILNEREMLFFAIIGVQAAVERGTKELAGKPIDEILADLTKQVAAVQENDRFAQAGIILE